MTNMPMPTEAEKAATADRLREVANIIRAGLYAGANAPAIAMALQWLDAGASFFNIPATAPAPNPPAEAVPAPDLKVVPDEQK